MGRFSFTCLKCDKPYIITAATPEQAGQEFGRDHLAKHPEYMQEIQTFFQGLQERWLKAEAV